MQALHQLLLGQPFVALFAIITAGFLIGSITVKKVNLGSSGVLFAAIFAGHLGYAIPGGIGTLGLILFVYCVGISAGGDFFVSFVREGSKLAKLAVVIVASGGLIAWLGAQVLELPTDLAVGIFAGALTSTPALATASESFGESAAGVSIGYSIGYPFGVIGIVLFVQLLPRLFKYNLDDVASQHAAANDKEKRVKSVLVEVANPNLFGKKIVDSRLDGFSNCQVSRVFKGDQLIPLSYDDDYSQGQLLLVVGDESKLDVVIDYLGRKSEKNVLKDVENERRQVLVTNRNVTGKTIHELATLKNYGIVITRIKRHGLTFVPNSSVTIQANDLLTVVGQSDSLSSFAKAVGHRSSAIDATDLLSLSAGLTLGIIIGLIPIGLPGGTPITLGLAGGLLLVALLLGHFGKVGALVGYIPRPTRLLLQELGLVFFLADAGIRGGDALVETVSEYGLSLLVLGMSISVVPLMLAWLLARKCFNLDPLQSLGGICGGMTSTPALGAITAKTDSQVPVISYISAYPIALICMIVTVRILIDLL